MRTRALHIAAGSVIAVICFGLWSEYKNAQFASELRDYVLPIDDVSSLSRDEVHLYRYLIETRLDPLFALAGVETATLRTALDALEKSRNTTLASLNADDRTLLQENLYPIEFLSALADTEDARRAFLDQTSFETARAYHDSLLKTMHGYNTALLATANILRTFEVRSVGFWQGITDAPFIATQLEKLSADTSHLITKENHRFNCSSYGLWCTALPKTMPHLETQYRETLNLIPESALPSTVMRNKQIIDSRVDQSLPIILVNDSHCTLNEEPGYIRFLSNIPPTRETPIIRIRLLNDLYFRDLTNAHDPFEKTLSKMGIRYGFLPTDPFTCLDFGADYADTLNTYYVQKKLAEHPIFTPIANSRDTQLLQLAHAEETIRSSQDILSTNTVETYISLAQSLIVSKGEKVLAQHIGKDNLLRIEDLITTWRARSAQFESTIQYLDYESISTRSLAREGTLNPEIALLLHSQLYSLYLMTNRTISPSFTTLMKERKVFTPSELGIISLNDTLSTQYSLQQLINIVNTGTDAANSLRQ